jgi:pilus assembly protein Flp/PilA
MRPTEEPDSVSAGGVLGSPITIILVAPGVDAAQNTQILPSEGAIIRRPSMLVRSEKGQGLAEYALILALIAIVAVLALIFLGNTISSILQQIGDSL